MSDEYPAADESGAGRARPARAPRRGGGPRGFAPAHAFLRDTIRSAGEERGFAVTRLLTHWAEVAGPEVAAVARPVRIGYGRDGLGATLTLLTSGTAGPMLQMCLPELRRKVNACYGYNAVSRIVLTQTAPTGFAEGQAAFDPAPPAPRTPPPVGPEAARRAEGVGDPDLRAALERLAQNVLSRPGPEGADPKKKG
ncbi:DUF721 domain-containing protein [Frigidibacter oleivorans]|uniref:DUF721 domain-containing protein n=1 Tax=Frigidibacter oleivorans TaxID=2487129 RepID=UPI000F8D4CA1|nr:DUF721 domain-containing protein [Frigidibacter oleivorans]